MSCWAMQYFLGTIWAHGDFDVGRYLSLAILHVDARSEGQLGCVPGVPSNAPRVHGMVVMFFGQVGGFSMG
jgi:hypothetical protein